MVEDAVTDAETVDVRRRLVNFPAPSVADLGDTFYLAERILQKSALHVATYINDAYYYLSGWIPVYKTILYISGIDFYCFPGMYRLPCNEGTYTIYADD